MVGIPAAVQNLLNVTSMTILNNFAAVYGSSAVAAIGIAYKIHLIPLHATLGVSNGIMPLVGYNYASGNVKRMKEALMFTGRAMLGFMLVISVLFYVFSNGMITAFIKNETVIELGSAFLRGFTLALPFQVIDFLGVGVYQACGMGSKSLLFAVMRKIVLEIPALFLLNRLFPMYGLAYAQPFAEFVLSIAAIVVLCRIFKGLEAKNAVVSATGK
jgi:Na+-driven multidrug efflux pump